MGTVEDIIKVGAPAVGYYLGGPAGAAVGAGISGIIASNEQTARDAQVFRENAQLQREFAQMGIRWKVDDAKAAGIHPLAALGAQTHSFSPVSVGGGSDPYQTMGQDIGRAMMASETENDKTIRALQIEGLQLDNQMKASQIRQINSNVPSHPGASLAIPGQGQTAIPPVVIKSAETTAREPGYLGKEAGSHPDYTYVQGDDGALTRVPSKSTKELIEDQFMPEMMWSSRNVISPFLDGGAKPPKNLLPNGMADWDWSVTRQQWVPISGQAAYDRDKKSYEYKKNERSSFQRAYRNRPRKWR